MNNKNKMKQNKNKKDHNQLNSELAYTINRLIEHDKIQKHVIYEMQVQ